MTNVATRLLTLITLLQNQPNQKANELADKLGVSLRTVHRYFAMLDEMGIPVYAERGPYGGFSLVRGYKLPPLTFSLEEAVTVYLGTDLIRETWGTLYQDAARSALAKVENILPDEQRAEIQWARRSLISTNLYRAELASLSPVMEKLRQATRERVQISIQYQGLARENRQRRKVDPYALVFRSGWWYLIGHCHLRKAPRTFRVDRIQTLKMLATSFEYPAGFDAQVYLQEEFKNQPIIRAHLRFVPEAAFMVKSNLSMWESMHENKDGSMDVTLTAPDLPWLASMTLSFANWVTVQEPPELKSLVQEWAQATLERYNSLGADDNSESNQLTKG